MKLDLLDESADARLGAALKRAYLEILTSEAGITEPFAGLVTVSVEAVARESAAELEKSYRSGVAPSRDDSAVVARTFARRFVAAFRDSLCREFSDDGDTSAFGKGMIVVLAPTIMTLLQLNTAYAALSIPIAIIVARMGLTMICNDYRIQQKSEAFVIERLELHRSNLVSLERALSAGADEQTVRIFRASVEYEQEKIEMLQSELRKLRSGAA